jgi:hypothetical protein
MSNKEFDISINTWLSGNGENYKVLRVSRFGKQYSIWVQNYLLNNNPSSAYDAYYIEDGEPTLHEMFASEEEAMDVASYIVGHYEMDNIENSIGVFN